MTRTKRVTLTFRHPFTLHGAGRELAAGRYEMVRDDELIGEVFVPVYRRVATLILLPAQAHRQSTIAMVDVDPADLAAAHARDRAMLPAAAPAARGAP